MFHPKTAVLITIGAASLGLLTWGFPPKAGADRIPSGVGAAGREKSAATRQDQAMAQAAGGLNHFSPWTPRPPLQRLLAPPGPTLQLSTTTWTSIGPSPLATTSPAAANFNVSGRITAIAAHPTDANTIYVAPAGGGVWKTINGGTTWTSLTDVQRTLSMGATANAK